MNLEDIREKLETKEYLFYFLNPVNFNHSLMARLFISLNDSDKAKKLIFYWVWIFNDSKKSVTKKFKSETIQLLEATGKIVNKCGGKWFSNLWQLQDFVKGLYERNKN